MTRADSPHNVAHHKDRAPIVVLSLWLALSAAAIFSGFHRITSPAASDIAGIVLNALLPAAGTMAFILAVRKARGRMRVADGFYPLVLLNPLLFAGATPFHPTLMATGLLSLMAGSIIAMRANRLSRYLAVAILAALLTSVSETFMLLLPAIVAWLIFAGYSLAKSPTPYERKRGIAVMMAAEIGLLVFGLACIVIDATATPEPNTLFASIVSFIEFPLLVVAIVMLALGWRRGPGGKAPPYFPGMLALLLGLLGMLLNNFQTGQLRAPGADQTVFILCLVYTVFALHGPRRLQWFVPPILLLAAVAYTFFR